jgi:hypothetical protein
MNNLFYNSILSLFYKLFIISENRIIIKVSNNKIKRLKIAKIEAIPLEISSAN